LLRVLRANWGHCPAPVVVLGMSSQWISALHEAEAFRCVGLGFMLSVDFALARQLGL